jgi:hypothetical protein
MKTFVFDMSIMFTHHILVIQILHFAIYNYQTRKNNTILSYALSNTHFHKTLKGWYKDHPHYSLDHIKIEYIPQVNNK